MIYTHPLSSNLVHDLPVHISHKLVTGSMTISVFKEYQNVGDDETQYIRLQRSSSVDVPGCFLVDSFFPYIDKHQTVCSRDELFVWGRRQKTLNDSFRVIKWQRQFAVGDDCLASPVFAGGHRKRISTHARFHTSPVAGRFVCGVSFGKECTFNVRPKGLFHPAFSVGEPLQTPVNRAPVTTEGYCCIDGPYMELIRGVYHREHRGRPAAR